MRNKAFTAVVSCLTAVLLLFGALPVAAAGAVRDAQSVLDGIAAHKCEQAAATDIQQWIDGALTKEAGVSAEWYAIALSQYGEYDFSSYRRALSDYLDTNEVYSASSRLKYALALIATGSTDPYIHTTLQDAIGQQGVMSWIYGLHLLNNGYTGAYTLASVKQKLLSLQLSDGGWAITGANGDVDTTAMAVQALAPHYQSDQTVKAAVDNALALLSKRQRQSGDYASYGVGNPESTAQVLVALSSLGVDYEADSRFIKDGNSLLDGIRLYQLANGSFCHKQGGTTSDTATVQVFYAMVSYLRMKNGQTGLYILDAGNPAGVELPDAGATKPADAQRPTSTTGKHATSAPATTTQATTRPPATQTTAQEQVSTTPPEHSDTSGQTVAGGLSQTDDLSAPEDDQPHREPLSTQDKTGKGYKLWVCLAIVAIAGGACVLLYLLKKRSPANSLVIIAVAAVAMGVVLLTNFQTTGEYYDQGGAEKENTIGTVTLTIRCDTIPDKSADHIPDDGVILDAAAFALQEGDTVYDILREAVAANRIHLETSGSGDSLYVQGMHHIYEFDFGDLSGWLYRVNGTAASVSCGEYTLSAGDTIEWLYTCEMGKDLA